MARASLMTTLVCLATVVASTAGDCAGGKRVGTHCVCSLKHSCRGTKCTLARTAPPHSSKEGTGRRSAEVKARSGYSLSKCTDCTCVADRAKIPLPKDGGPETYVPGHDGTYAQNYQVGLTGGVVKLNIFPLTPTHCLRMLVSPTQ